VLYLFWEMIVSIIFSARVNPRSVRKGISALLLLGSAYSLAETESALSTELVTKSLVTKSHGFALYGDLKYAADFRHFSYVNPDAPKGGDVTLMATGTFDTLNPYTMKGISPFNSPGTYMYGIGELNESLLAGTGEIGRSGDEPYSAYGLIAETVEYPEDRSWVQFNLRPIARFHDGTSITAADVVFSWETLKAQGHPRFALDFSEISSVVAISPLRVKVTFKQKNSGSAILRFGEMPILPKHYWESRHFEKTTLEPPLLSGSYRVAEVKPGQSISLARVSDYWGEHLPVNRGKYNFANVRIEFYRDLTVAFEAFKGGEFDIFLDYTAKNWATAYNFPALNEGRIIKREIPHRTPSGTQGFFFNTRKDVFQDIRTRRALSSVFDFAWANENLFYGAYQRSTSYFPNSIYAASGLPSAEELKLLEPFKDSLPTDVFTRELPVDEHRPDRVLNREIFMQAVTLLEDAGWRVKDGALLNEKGNIFAFEILIRQKGLERVLLPFAKNLEKLGIKASIRLVDASQYKIRMDNFDFDMTTFVLSQSNTPAQEQQHYFHSLSADTPGSLNLSGIKNPAIDFLTTALLKVQNPNELRMTMQALDRVLLWNYYIVPNWHLDYHRVAYQNRFGIPETQPEYSLSFENWWEKPSRN
jgi:microcin C transport system substrate-binding protein